MGRLTGCCGCFDLRNGSKAVGITHLVLGSLSLISEIAGTAMLMQREDTRNRITSGVVVQIVLQFGVSILYLLFNSLLVHGVENNRRGMLLAWLIFSGILHGLQSVGVAIVFVVACVYGVVWLIFVILAVAGLIGVFWYWFVVVLHCHQEMREESGFVYGKQENVAM